MVEHFIKKYNKAHGLAVDGITPAALKILISCNWQGNIRELENTIERSMVLSEKKVLDADDIPEDIKACQGEDIYNVSEDEYSIKKAARIMEQKLIRKALNKAHGNKSRAAKLLELSYPALLSKISEYDLN